MTSPARTNYRYRYQVSEQGSAEEGYEIFQEDFNAFSFLTPSAGWTLVRTFMQCTAEFGYYITGENFPYIDPWWVDMSPWVGLQMTKGVDAAPTPTAFEPAAGDDQAWIQSNFLDFRNYLRADSVSGPYESATFHIPQAVQQTRANRLVADDDQVYGFWVCTEVVNSVKPCFDVSDPDGYSGFINVNIDVTLFFELPAE